MQIEKTPDYLLFIELYEKKIRGMIANSCRGRKELIDEIFSDVVLHYTENAFRTFDPTKGQTLYQHVMHTLRWYVGKWLNKRLRNMRRETSETDLSNGEPGETVLRELAIAKSGEPGGDALDNAEIVRKILANVPEYERALLMLRHVAGLSFPEIAKRLGVSESTARTQCDNALVCAKRVAARLPYDI